MRILTSPWWRAPFQLLRRPGVALSLIAATFVAALPAAAAPLFLGTAQSATVNDQVANSCPNVSGVTVGSYLFNSDPDEVGKLADRVKTDITKLPNIGPATTTVYQSRLPVIGLPKDDPRRTYVEFTLEPVGAGTRLTVVESGFAQLPTDAHRTAYEGNTKGWASELGELVSYLDAG